MISMATLPVSPVTCMVSFIPQWCDSNITPLCLSEGCACVWGDLLSAALLMDRCENNVVQRSRNPVAIDRATLAHTLARTHTYTFSSTPHRTGGQGSEQRLMGNVIYIPTWPTGLPLLLLTLMCVQGVCECVYVSSDWAMQFSHAAIFKRHNYDI